MNSIIDYCNILDTIVNIILVMCVIEGGEGVSREVVYIVGCECLIGHLYLQSATICNVYMITDYIRILN